MVLVFLATALCALRYGVLRDVPRIRLPPGALFFALFLIYAALRISKAAVPYDAHLEVLKLASYLAAYWVWTELAGKQGRWRWLVAGLLIVVTMMAWYAIIQHTHGSRMVLTLIRPPVYEMRASGAYICPNHFANLLEMTAPFALAVTLAPSAGLSLRLLSGYSMLVALPPLLLTQSRSGWIGICTGLAVTISLLGLRRSVGRFLALALLTPLVLAAVGVAVWFLSPMVQARVAAALAGDIRLQLWQDTWSMIREQPWLGWGPYSYRWIYPHFWHHMKTYLDPQFAHNDYLQLWAEYGLVGGVLLLSAFAVGVVRLLAILRTCESDRGAYLIAGLLGTLAATSAHACFDYNFHIFGNVQVLVMLSGLVAGVLISSGDLPIRARPPARARWISLVAVLALGLAGLSARAVTSYAFVRKGDTAREIFEMDPARQAYERAARVAPQNWNAHRGLGQVWGTLAFWNRDPETRAQQIDQALASYTQARKGNLWDTDILFGMSRMYGAQGRPEEALNSLQEVVTQVPHHRDFLGQLGLQLRGMGRYEEALATFRRVRALGPSEMADLNIQSLTRLMKESSAAK
jgi:O-antigen ligase